MSNDHQHECPLCVKQCSCPRPLCDAGDGADHSDAWCQCQVCDACGRLVLGENATVGADGDDRTLCLECYDIAEKWSEAGRLVVEMKAAERTRFQAEWDVCEKIWELSKALHALDDSDPRKAPGYDRLWELVDRVGRDTNHGGAPLWSFIITPV